MSHQPTVLSGMRPTGRLHIGHYLGAIKNWVALQETHRCFFAAVDWHALAGEGYKKSKEIVDSTREMVLDWIACGVDPARATLFVQSHVKEHAELHLLLSMITPTPWLIRNPAVKDQARDLGLVKEGEDVTAIDYGYLGYPVLQAADILLYGASDVPIGEDQLPHLELTREIVRRFNFIFGETFREPAAKLTEVPRLAGIDGKKMSKSLDNCIYMTEDDKSVQKKVRRMVTDTAKVRLGDPGNPSVCSVFAYHKIFTKPALAEIDAGCRSGALGCGDCKNQLATSIVTLTAPIRERRAALPASMADDILADGRKRAAEVAGKTMARARKAAGLAPYPTET
jgi:tryptophanyl-tRNA synthetase